MNGKKNQQFRKQRKQQIKGFDSLASLFNNTNAGNAFHQLTEIKRMQRNHRVYGRTDFPEFESLLGAIFPKPDDGKTHINVSGDAETDIGKLLGIYDNLPYYDEVLGVDVRNFRSFYSYVMGGCKNHEMLLKSYNWREKEEHAPLEKSQRVPNNFVLYAHAYWQKIKFYPAMVEVLKNLKLPIDCYRYDEETGQYIRSVTNGAIAHALRIIQQALIEDREPNFYTLLDKSTQEYINKNYLLENDVIEQTNQIIRDLLSEGIEYFQANNITTGTTLQNEVSFAQSPVTLKSSSKSKSCENQEKTTEKPQSLNHVLPSMQESTTDTVQEGTSQEDKDEQGIELKDSVSTVVLSEQDFKE